MMINRVGFGSSQSLRSDSQAGRNVGFGNEVESSKSKSDTSVSTQPLDYSRAIKQFGKGFIAPLKSMVSSPTNIAVTAGVGTLTVYILRKVPQLGPIFIAAGVAAGALQTALGIKKAVQEKTSEGKEKGIYNAGQGAFSLAASMLTARGFLADAAKAEGIVLPEQAQGMLRSTLSCIKGIKTYSSSAIKKVTNDNFITDVLSTIAGKTPTAVKEGAEIAAQEAAAREAAGESTSIIKSALERRVFPAAESKEAIDSTVN